MRVIFIVIALTNLLVLHVSSHHLSYAEGENCRPGHSEWICQEAKYCAKQVENVDRKFHNNCRRTNSKGVNLECCPKETAGDQEQDDVKKVIKRQTASPISTAIKMCKKYAEAVFKRIKSPVLVDTVEAVTEKHDTCGISQSPLVIGGTDASPREFPHMVLVGHRDFPILWLCGGSLISDEWVVSAAHCTSTLKGTLAKWVLLGDLKVLSEDDAENSSPLMIQISKRINHPKYERQTSYNDIALYKLQKKVEFNEFIRPLCLFTQPAVLDKKALATGWGNTQNRNESSVSTHLQKVGLDLMSDTKLCGKKFVNAPKLLKAKIPNGVDVDSMICAWTPGKDTCQGDSGGPLQIRINDTEIYCMYSLIGITSFGDECAADKPGVYTRVSYYIPWIVSHVWPQ